VNKRVDSHHHPAPPRTLNPPRHRLPPPFPPIPLLLLLLLLLRLLRCRQGIRRPPQVGEAAAEEGVQPAGIAGLQARGGLLQEGQRLVLC
jgi:hypothetical protein